MLNIEQNSALGEYFAFSDAICGYFFIKIGSKKKEKKGAFLGIKKKL